MILRRLTAAVCHPKPTLENSVHGDGAYEEFGYKVCGKGDFNGDNYPDIMVSAPKNSHQGWERGRVLMYSGEWLRSYLIGQTPQTQRLLWTAFGEHNGDRFGSSLAFLGNLNSNAQDEILIRALFDDTLRINAGMIQVHSGGNGAVLFTDYETSAEYRFGISVCSVGDIDQDDIRDFIAGVPGDYLDGFRRYSEFMRLYSGNGQTLIEEIHGIDAHEAFGFSVASLSAVNNDTVPDFYVGAMQDCLPEPKSGYANVYSGIDRNVLDQLEGSSFGSDFGWEGAAVGDIYQDGHDDFHN